MKKIFSVILSMALLACGSVCISSCGDDDDDAEKFTGETVASFSEEGNMMTLTLETQGALVQTETATFDEDELLESYVCRYKYAKSSYADIAWREFEKEDPDLEVIREGNTIIVDMTPMYEGVYFNKAFFRQYFQERVESTNKTK